ncbi:MAG TPA: hypothetical protein PKO06_23025, partial [Candidatus Ozemobacteraceae bacterium]|nr:hypothetical protein [Candidatus Ozemobacteraceae bacterium]
RGWDTGQYAAGKDLWWNSNNCDSYIQRDGKQPHSGKYSLHLVNRSAKAPHTYGTTQQLLSIVPGQRYRVTLWAKGKQLTSPGSVSIVVDEAWSVRPIVLPQGSFDWTQFTGTFSLGTKQTSLRLLMEGPGEVWLDDLTIEPATDSEPVVNAPVAASEMLNQVDEESDLPADLDLEASGERFDESGQRADLDAGGGAGDVFAEFKRGDSEKPNFDDLPGTGEPGSMDPTDGPGVVSHPGDPDRKPLTVSVSASSARVPASTWVRFVARARGGTKPYTFAWTDDGVAKNSRSANLSLLWKKKSVNVVSVLVTDSSNPPLQARANVTIIVDEPSKEPSRPVLSLQSVILSPASVSPGGQVKVNAIFRLQHWPASAAVIEATFAMETSSRGSVVRKVFRFRCPVKNGQAYSNVWVRFPTRADARPGPIRAAVKLRVSGLVARKMGH